MPVDQGTVGAQEKQEPHLYDESAGIINLSWEAQEQDALIPDYIAK